mgnify:CR=1 FL=1
MIVNKIVKNQIKKLVKELVGTSDNKWELRKIQNELRTIRGTVAQLKKDSHPKRELKEKNGKYYLEEVDG